MWTQMNRLPALAVAMDRRHPLLPLNADPKLVGVERMDAAK
jgi:hypothetical protein